MKIRGVNAKRFNGELFREIQHFSEKGVAASYAKGLRKRGIMSQDVKVRVTREKKGHVVWVRGK